MENDRTILYDLDAIISVEFRVNSVQATQFCQWYIYVLGQFARLFFKKAQNKMRLAVQGDMADKLIIERVSAEKENLRLTI